MFKYIILLLSLLLSNSAIAQYKIDKYRSFEDDNRIYWSYELRDSENLKGFIEYEEHFKLWYNYMESLNQLSFKSILKAVEMSHGCYYVTNSNIFPPRAYLYRLSVDKDDDSVMKSRALVSSFATLIKYDNVSRVEYQEYKRIFNMLTICGAILNANGLGFFTD